MILTPNKSSARSNSPAKLGRTSPGALLLLLPLVTLAIGIAYLQHRRPEPAARPAAPNQELLRAVDTWHGEVQLPGGTLVTARLSRLHPDSARQEFDARTLRQRLNLQDGEPWQLDLTSVGRDGEVMHLNSLQVKDAEGDCLGALARKTSSDSQSSDSQVVDPITVLFQAPSEVQVGSAQSLLLWGRAPGAGAELRGLASRISLHCSAYEVPLRGASLASLRKRESSELPAGRLRALEGEDGAVNIEFEQGDSDEE